MNVVDIEWDDGNWLKCAKHGVSKGEIEHVLSGEPMVLPDRSPVTSETRYNAVGRNATGRYLFIVFAMRSQDAGMVLRPISARYMHKKEIDHYEQYQINGK
ncbi:MAG: BrnT family toxin [Nitratireductor sp.]